MLPIINRSAQDCASFVSHILRKFGPDVQFCGIGPSFVFFSYGPHYFKASYAGEFFSVTAIEVLQVVANGDETDLLETAASACWQMILRGCVRDESGALAPAGGAA